MVVISGSCSERVRERELNQDLEVPVVDTVRESFEILRSPGSLAADHLTRSFSLVVLAHNLKLVGGEERVKVAIDVVSPTQRMVFG